MTAISSSLSLSLFFLYLIYTKKDDSNLTSVEATLNVVQLCNGKNLQVHPPHILATMYNKENGEEQPLDSNDEQDLLSIHNQVEEKTEANSDTEEAQPIIDPAENNPQEDVPERPQLTKVPCRFTG